MAQQPQNAPGGKTPGGASRSSSPSAQPHSGTDDSQRRGFLRKFLAVAIGGFVSLFPAAAGLAVFVDPLRKRKPGSSGGGQEGFLKVASLDSLLVGSPRRVTVINDRVDAWNLFPQEPVGAVYLLRNDKGSVLALNVTCPHAGCSVDFDPDKKAYQCPCHKSSFQLDGNILNPDSPAPRGLDPLEVDEEKLKSGEVWVRFQNFQSGTPERIAEA